MISTQIRFLAQFLQIIHYSLPSKSCSIADFVWRENKKVSELKSFGFLALNLGFLSISNILTDCWREWLSEGWEKVTTHRYSTGKKGPVFLQHVPWIRAWNNDWPWPIPFPSRNGYFSQYMAEVNRTVIFPLLSIYHGWSRSTDLFSPRAEVKSYWVI